MSLAAKQIFAKNIEKSLNSLLTADNVTATMEILFDNLNKYEMEMVNEESLNGESEDFLNAFLEAKQIEGRSNKTIDRYRYILRKAMKKLNVPLKNITIYHLRSYLMDMKKKGISDSTIEGIRGILCSYFVWLQKEGLLINNPCSNINAIKCAKKVRLPFSDIDIENLKAACDSTRDKAIINFLLSTGCRISEVCELNKDDIDFQNLECIVHGKGNKERTVYINNITCMFLKKYINERDDKNPALFISSKRKNRITPGGIRSRLKDIGKKANVENVHPHRFRRTLTTNLINHGMAIQEVAYILGHDKIDTTMKYAYIEKINVKNSYKKYS